MSEPILPVTSGIYKITCTANQKIYIGSALNLRSRHNNHWIELRLNRHCNIHLQRAWNKHGEHTFVFEVLELVLPISLTAREQYWLDKLKPFGRRGFNIAPHAGSSLGMKHTPEAREKIKQAKIGKERTPAQIEQIEKLRQSNIGRKHSPKTLEKKRQAQLGKKLSPATKEKLRQAHVGKKFPNRKPRSPESIEKQRRNMIGKKQSPEQIENHRQTLLGRKHTPEHTEKIRQALLGKKRKPEHEP